MAVLEHPVGAIIAGVPDPALDSVLRRICPANARGGKRARGREVQRRQKSADAEIDREQARLITVGALVARRVLLLHRPAVLGVQQIRIVARRRRGAVQADPSPPQHSGASESGKATMTPPDASLVVVLGNSGR